MGDISTDFGSFDNSSFFAGTEVSALTTSVTLAAGQGVLKKGALLGKVTADDTYKLVDTAAADGSQVASLVLATPEIDTADTDLDIVAYSRGIFNYDALYVADSDTVDAHEEELRDVSIYFKTNYPSN